MSEKGELVLRGYRAGDAEGMYALDLVCFEEVFRFDLAAMRRFAEARGALVVVAERAGEPAGGMAGFAIVQVERRRGGGRRGYVVTLDIDPSLRRAGLAGRLMRGLERQAAGAGAGSMELDVFQGNAGAIRFYEGMGYERVGVREGFYGRGRDEAGKVVRLDAFAYRKELRQA